MTIDQIILLLFYRKNIFHRKLMETEVIKIKRDHRKEISTYFGKDMQYETDIGRAINQRTTINQRAEFN